MPGAPPCATGARGAIIVAAARFPPGWGRPGGPALMPR